ncbi:MAG: PIG-L family deacetylase [Candidatus Acidiferrum sp.]
MYPSFGRTLSLQPGRSFLSGLAQQAASKRTRLPNWSGALAILAFLVCSPIASFAAPQAAKPILQADERYKVDILLVVAHPDDEGAATPYLARAIDEGKRVAIVYGTRGSSGENQAGAEQAAALGDIREMEARRAAVVLGIDKVWFLGGKDTASQDVLQSLANWGHGKALENLVRLVRLTRPDVILTFLPGTFIGEDHGDHQAAGVLATEAFDLAGDPTVFPEQVSAPLRRLEPFLENLRPWQTKKIYYFPDADNEEMFRDKGPKYAVTEISKSAKQAYWRVALESFRRHETQAKSFIDSLSKMDEAQIEKLVASDGFWSNGISFVLGKSLVGGSVTGDIFEGITPGAIAFARTEVTPAPARPEISVVLAGPWNYYAEFRWAHGLTNLPHPEPPEIALQAGTELVIPLWLGNSSSAAQEINLTVRVPSGWTVGGGGGKFVVPAKQTAASRIEVQLPALVEGVGSKAPLQEVSVHAECNGQSVGDIKLRVELRKRALPE